MATTRRYDLTVEEKDRLEAMLRKTARDLLKAARRKERRKTLDRAVEISRR